jgi:hypothetical protein
MENAQLHTSAEPSAPNSANRTTALRLTKRQMRVIAALVQANDWVSRESIDRIAGASNGPQIILELRRKVTSWDGIEMARQDALDRDGRSCKPGRYRLTPIGRQRVEALGWECQHG